jgi:hypothetical protein
LIPAVVQAFTRLNITRFVWFSFLYFAIVGGIPEVARAQSPRFEDYGVTVRRGKVAPLNLQSHALARKYWTLIRQQMRDEGINFAGRYTLASMGCGTGCSITAIIDARTGHAYFPKQLSGWTGLVGDYEPSENEAPWTFRSSSTLLKAIGRENIGETLEERHGPSGIYYYEWNDQRLRLVKFTAVGSYPDPDPPVEHQPHGEHHTIPSIQHKAR